LSGVYVKPESRKTGLGSTLVKAVEDAARVLGNPLLYLYTAPNTAAKFYAPMGWHEILTPRYEGKEVVIMQKALGSDNLSPS
jgi:GNAT superfamily N-acetyltransferase